jgi:hypothetical protein
MFKQSSSSSYQTFRHLNEMDPMLRRIQRGYIHHDDDDEINNITKFGYTVAGVIVICITIILVVVVIL